MVTEELSLKLWRKAVKRNPGTSVDEHVPVARLVERYQLELTMNNFAYSNGPTFTDMAGQTVAVYQVQSNGTNMTSHMCPRSEILVVADQKLTLGWVSRSQINDFEAGFSCHVTAVRDMPAEFWFKTPCLHLAAHAGVWRESAQAWECFGCGEMLADGALSV